jgi:hypothetical protein
LRPWAAARAERRLKLPGKGRAHDLGDELIVSVTSYPARFATLHLTLACLLDQSVKADRTVLWIAHEHLPLLPPLVRAIEQRGLEICGCEDLRSFKKLIPAIQAFPDAFIATADDDVYYPRDWLEELVKGAQPGVIACHRAHRMKISVNGAIAPYLDWAFDVQDAAARAPSTNILPTGVGGILYAPHCLDPRVIDRALFQRLCPDGDDLWFYWCARMAGTKYRKVGRKFRQVAWGNTQVFSLWAANEAGGNDAMIAALQNEFGYLDCSVG